MPVLVTICKRSLIYPYIRHWKYTRKILADVAKVLYLGKRCILKCFLALYRIMEHSEQHYILNKLFITDYCVWIQNNLEDSTIAELANAFNETKRTLEHSPNQGKDLVKFNLPKLEEWATQFAEDGEEEDEEAVAEGLPEIPQELLIYE